MGLRALMGLHPLYSAQAWFILSYKKNQLLSQSVSSYVSEKLNKEYELGILIAI